MSKKLRPLHDCIVVKRVSKTKTASGIVLPETTEKSDHGLVLAVGPGKKDEKGARLALDVCVGDHILFRKYAGQAFKLEGVKLDGIEADDEVLALQEGDVLAILEG